MEEPHESKNPIGYFSRALSLALNRWGEHNPYVQWSIVNIKTYVCQYIFNIQLKVLYQFNLNEQNYMHNIVVSNKMRSKLIQCELFFGAQIHWSRKYNKAKRM